MNFGMMLRCAPRKSVRKPKTSTMMLGYSLLETSTCPKDAFSARSSQGSHVTAPGPERGEAGRGIFHDLVPDVEAVLLEYPFLHGHDQRAVPRPRAEGHAHRRHAGVCMAGADGRSAGLCRQDGESSAEDRGG